MLRGEEEKGKMGRKRKERTAREDIKMIQY